MKTFFKKIFKFFLDLIYPPICIRCKKVGIQICSECEKIIKKEFNPKLVNINAYTNLYSAFEYKNNAKKAIKQFKFKNQKESSIFFAKFMLEVLNKFKDKVEFDFITFVPMSLDQKNERGYNQSEELAKSLSKNLNIPVINILTKTRDNVPQKGLNLPQRQENVKNVYKLINYKFKEIIKNKNIIIVDDITTTGSTFFECAQTIGKYLPKSVNCVCVCRA